MDDHGLTGADHRRQASEALIYASLIHHGFSHNMTIFSDGAPQFNIFNHAQCWFHAERPLYKVIPVNEQQVQAQLWCRTWFWAINRDLKAIKKAPADMRFYRFARRLGVYPVPKSVIKTHPPPYSAFI